MRKLISRPSARDTGIILQTRHLIVFHLFCLLFLGYTSLTSLQVNNQDAQNNSIYFDIERDGVYPRDHHSTRNVVIVETLDYYGSQVEILLHLEMNYDLISYRMNAVSTLLAYCESGIPSDFRLYWTSFNLWFDTNEVAETSVSLPEVEDIPEYDYIIYQSVTYDYVAAPTFIDKFEITIEMDYEVYSIHSQSVPFQTNKMTIEFDIVGFNFDRLGIISGLLLGLILASTAYLGSSFFEAGFRFNRNKVRDDWIYLIIGYLLITYQSTRQLFSFDPYFRLTPYVAYASYTWTNLLTVAYAYVTILIIPFYVIKGGNPFNQRAPERKVTQEKIIMPTSIQSSYSELSNLHPAPPPPMNIVNDMSANFRRFNVIGSLLIITITAILVSTPSLLIDTSSSTLHFLGILAGGAVYILWYLFKVRLFLTLVKY